MGKIPGSAMDLAHFSGLPYPGGRYTPGRHTPHRQVDAYSAVRRIQLFVAVRPAAAHHAMGHGPVHNLGHLRRVHRDATGHAHLPGPQYGANGWRS